VSIWVASMVILSNFHGENNLKTGPVLTSILITTQH
jgi:hypothetical protein